MEHLEPVEEVRSVLQSVYTISLDSIQMALALVVALAWYAFVKHLIAWAYPKQLSGAKDWQMLGLFAVVMTLVFAVAIVVMQRVLKARIVDRPVQFVVAAPVAGMM
jgi:hypothetical protein